MAQIINCTNPICGTRIEVPEGAVQVICPHCNTWHFPSPSEEENASSGYSEEQYNTPQLPPMDNGENMGLPPMPVAPPVAAAENESPSQKRGASREVGSIGYLVTLDGIRLALRQGKNVIGRQSGDLTINDKTVSRRHCVIEVNMKQGGQGWEFVIYDIGHLEGQSSTNGVFISGRSLRLQDYEQISIYHETSIKLGNVDLVLQCE